MHLAPQTSAFSLAPRTHISRANVIMKHLTAQTFFTATTRGSQQFTFSIPLQAVYTCAAAVCVSPCSLVISTHSGCTIWCTSDNESDYQWTSDCLITPCIGIVTSAANPCGACNCQQPTTLTSRGISAFCGRWDNQLGPARSLPLTMTANERSCGNTMPLAGTELLTSSMH